MAPLGGGDVWTYRACSFPFCGSRLADHSKFEQANYKNGIRRASLGTRKAPIARGTVFRPNTAPPVRRPVLRSSESEGGSAAREGGRAGVLSAAPGTRRSSAAGSLGGALRVRERTRAGPDPRRTRGSMASEAAAISFAFSGFDSPSASAPTRSRPCAPICARPPAAAKARARPEDRRPRDIRPAIMRLTEGVWYCARPQNAARIGKFTRIRR